MRTRLVQKLMLVGLSLTFTACFAVSPKPVQLTPEWQLQETDTATDTALCKRHTEESSCAWIGPNGIVEAGADKEFIILRYEGDGLANSFPKGETRYGLLRLKDETYFGPYDLQDFITQRRVLGVAPALQFTVQMH